MVPREKLRIDDGSRAAVLKHSLHVVQFGVDGHSTTRRKAKTICASIERAPACKADRALVRNFSFLLLVAYRGSNTDHDVIHWAALRHCTQPSGPSTASTSTSTSTFIHRNTMSRKRILGEREHTEQNSHSQHETFLLLRLEITPQVPYRTRALGFFRPYIRCHLGRCYLK